MASGVPPSRVATEPEATKPDREHCHQREHDDDDPRPRRVSRAVLRAVAGRWRWTENIWSIVIVLIWDLRGKCPAGPLGLVVVDQF